MERVRKVVAVVVDRVSDRRHLLVFEHPLIEGGVMIQMPAGTVEPKEQPEIAVLRELEEETGVRGEIVGLAGVVDELLMGEPQRRWIYVVQPVRETLMEWPYTCDCRVPIKCYWLPLEGAEVVDIQSGWLAVARDWMTEVD